MNSKQTAKIVDYVENFYGSESCGVWEEHEGQNTAELYGMSESCSEEIKQDHVVLYAYVNYYDFDCIRERADDYGIDRDDYIFCFLGREEEEHMMEGVVRFFIS